MMTDAAPHWIAEIKERDRDLRALVRMAETLPPDRPAITLGVKDIIDVAGLATECASEICKGQMPAQTAPCVERLVAAGATVVAKTVTTEYATTKPGPTRNPLNLKHTPGGSSSGSAAGVAAGLYDWALGTQTAGSVIRPAAFCGIAGFLPSAGYIPRQGVKIMSPTLDRVGIFARDMVGIGAMLKAFPAWTPETARPARALKIAMLPMAVWDSADAATRKVVREAADACRTAGMEVSDGLDPTLFLEMMDAQKVVMGYEIRRALERELTEHRELLSDELRDFCEISASISHVDYAAALEVADRFRLWIQQVFSEHDAVLGPAAAGLAPEGLGWTGDPFVNRIWSLSKLPAACVPSAAAANGLKASVQLTAAPGRDAFLWALASEVEPLVAKISPD